MNAIAIRVWDRIQAEPVLTQYVVNSVLGVFVAFGLHWDAQQVMSTLVLSGAILSLLTRRVVTPLVKVQPDTTVLEPK